MRANHPIQLRYPIYLWQKIMQIYIQGLPCSEGYIYIHFSGQDTLYRSMPKSSSEIVSGSSI